MFSIYNAVQEAVRITRSELLFSAGNPYEVQALYNSVADLGAGYAVQQAEFDEYYTKYEEEKRKLIP